MCVRLRPGSYLVDNRYEINRTREGALHVRGVVWYWRDRETGAQSGYLETKVAALEDLDTYRVRAARPASTPLPLLETIAQMKREILEDMRRGVVPRTVRSFSDLHDHVDANEYGGFCDPSHVNAGIDPGDDAGNDYVNAAQDAVHGWLARGGHLEGVTHAAK